MNRAQRRKLRVRADAAPRASAANIDVMLQAAAERHKGGRFAEAEDLYRQVLIIDPGNADALHRLGVLANQVGCPDIAIDLIGQAIKARPRMAAYSLSLGNVFRGCGRLDEAAEAFRTAARLAPQIFDIRLALGDTLLAIGQRDGSESAYQQAIPAFKAAVRLQPGSPEAHCNLAIALASIGQLEDALDAAKTAVRLRPAFAEGLTNMGVILKDLGLARQALDAFDRADAIKPNTREIHFNRGNALVQLLRLDEAAQSFDRAIALGPSHADAQFSKACLSLLTGDLEGGFERYECRKAMNADLAARCAHGRALGRGDALHGKTLLVHAEQGLGDTVQFCRYLSVAADRGARVVLSAPETLLPLLAGFDARVEVIGQEDAPRSFDFQAALMSLPHVFGATLDSIPSKPAYLRADPGRLPAWSSRLGEGRKPRIGLVWAGNPKNVRDRQRSMPFAQMAALMDLDADWISLQKELRDPDQRAMRRRPELRVFSDQLTSFAETAALVHHLDLVVATDTAVAHLAAALGKPVFILLPFSPDWRWLLDREDSPWHPTARLFRQPSPGDWGAVLDLVKTAIADRFGL